jgi:hypothetical protein
VTKGGEAEGGESIMQAQKWRIWLRRLEAEGRTTYSVKVSGLPEDNPERNEMIEVGDITDWLELPGDAELRRFLDDVGTDSVLRQIGTKEYAPVYQVETRDPDVVRSVKPTSKSSMSVAVSSATLDQMLARLEPWLKAE